MTRIVATIINAARKAKALVDRPNVRRYIYRVVNAGVGVLVIHGLVTGNEAAAWLLLVNAVLGLADAKVKA